MFEVNDLRVSLTLPERLVPVAQAVSFRIEAGKLLGLIGESGSGKSVTALAITGLHRPPIWQVTGSVKLDGKDVPLGQEERMREIRGQDICYIMQNPMSAFDPLFTIGEHFRETGDAHRTGSHARTDRMAVEYLGRMRIPDPEKVLKSYPFECSGGMLQRIMIAIALMNRPRLLIADEPTTALDRTVQYEIIRLIGDLKKLGSSILFISHDLKAVRFIADEIAVMYGGYIVEQGAAQELLQTPMHPYTKALIGATPRFSKDPLPVLEGMPPSLLQRPGEGCPFAPRCEERMSGCARWPMQEVCSAGRMVRCVKWEGRRPDGRRADAGAGSR